MLDNLPTDISLIIINNLRLTCKKTKALCQFYSPNYNILIIKSVKLFIELFPYIKSISIRKKLFY